MNLVPAQTVRLSLSRKTFQSAPITLTPEVGRLSVTIRRPTAAVPANWDQDTTIKEIGRAHV